jgi:osmotically-inducible protein OsmY
MTPRLSRFAKALLPCLVACAALGGAIAWAAAPPPAQPKPAPPAPAGGAAQPEEKPSGAAPADAAPAPIARNIGGPGDYPLREKLVQRLSRDPDLAGLRPTIIMVNGGAVFSGPVPSWTMRRRALAVAGAIRGIINVTDQMTVPRGDVRDDAILKGIVSVLTERKDLLELTDLDVTVQDGVATLNGRVKDFSARVHAEEIAGTILGAQTIVNRLRPVTAPSGTDDLSIRKALARYLGDFREYPYPADLQVQVRDGVARLSGEVGIYLGRQQAGTMAALVGGVKRVDNRIKVEPSSQLPNTVVREAP